MAGNSIEKAVFPAVFDGLANSKFGELVSPDRKPARMASRRDDWSTHDPDSKFLLAASYNYPQVICPTIMTVILDCLV